MSESSTRRLEYIARADHTGLIQSRNAAYLVSLQQTEIFRAQCDRYSQLIEKLIMQIPQLIALNAESPEVSKFMPASSSTHAPSGVAPWAHTQPTPQAIHFKVYKDWRLSSASSGTSGQHPISENVAQKYIKDEHGVAVDGRLDA
ncbi:uncharacterized protein B0H18DRAFT_1125257 [Fomitopsis serialis]|uniref:uncharacterized protein n=1 Tax=Fomitopsis serialis TaxID=139415 RepID=UPI0020083775|nr:uncharacterized protein B0H18DRAFT_1125257 [Neoantrodia serialis]KAH9914821.1 hypothetical protein B0H18DRAFT_1125257 [Neoantrodia serialis]